MDTPDLRLDFCQTIAKQAGKIAVKMRQQSGVNFVSNKGHQDFVTEADHAVERFIRERIEAEFPTEAIVGEEEGVTGNSSTCWVIDPIDGTANYMRGLPEWAISIACAQNDNITHAVLDLPDIGKTASAQIGCGAFSNGERMRVSDIDTPAKSLIILGHSERLTVETHTITINKLLKSGFEYRRQGSACFGLYSVAAGWAEAYHEMYLNPWDAFAGMLLITEAGGTIKSKPVAEFLKSGSPFTATNNKIKLPMLDF